MAKAVPVEVRIADLPQIKQFISHVAGLLGVLARESDLPEIARLAADQVKRDLPWLVPPPHTTTREHHHGQEADRS